MKKMTTTLLAAALTCSLVPGSAFALGRPATQSVRAGLEQRLGGEMMASDTLQARTNGMAGMFASTMNWDAVGSMHATSEFVDGNVSVSIDKGMLENRGGTAIVAKQGNVVTVQFPNARPMQTACGGNAQQMLPDFLLQTAMDNSPQFGQQVPAGEMGQPGQPTQQPQQSLTSTVATAGIIVTSTVANTAADLVEDSLNAVTIVLSDENSQVKITSSGTYVVTGTSSDGNIVVKKGTTGVVLVLEDVDLTSTTGAPLSINKDSEVKLIISGNVMLTDNENPADEESADADVADAYDGAAIKVKAGSQVYITGDGTLTINGNAKNGIKGGDESNIVIDGEDLDVNITAANDGINGNYDVTILDGDLTINAGDDAIHADHILTIGDEETGEGPTIDVESCNEGLEGTVVNIFGGDIDINSIDDAINAANGDGVYEGELDYSFNMTGGDVTINSQGDGIDSNGDVNLIGGTATIHSASNGGEAGIDYDGDLYVSEDFQLNNQSGVAGPDGMGGQPGQMGNMGGQPGQQMNGQPNQQTTNQPGQMGSMNSQPGQQMYNQQTTNQPGSMTNQPGQQMGGQPGGRR